MAGEGTEDPSERDTDSAERDEALGVAVITISDTRSLENDEPSEAVVDAFERAGHSIETRERIGCAHDDVQSTVSRIVDRDDVDVVVTTGGTGVEPSDVTIEAVAPLLDKSLSAFGPLFTQLAYERIGTRVVAGRTLAGLVDDVPVCCLPGNADATRLATTEILLPEIDHLVVEASEEE